MAQHARQGSSSSSYPPAASPLSRRPRVKRRILFWPAFIPLILLSGLLMNWAILIPTAFAAPPAGTSAQGHLTFQQFLQEGQQSKASHGPFFFPQPKAPPKAGGMTPPKPSAEPPTMQPLVATLSASALAPQVAGSNVKPLNLKSNDGRLEVQIPSGAIDVNPVCKFVMLPLKQQIEEGYGPQTD